MLSQLPYTSDTITILLYCFKYAHLLKSGKALLIELVFTKQTSKESDDYLINNIEASSLYQLKAEAKSLHSAEILQYVITDYYNKLCRRRAIPVDLTIDGRHHTMQKDMGNCLPPPAIQSPRLLDISSITAERQFIRKAVDQTF
jgi:hypothetical protein